MIRNLFKSNRKFLSNVFSLGFIDLVSMALPFIYLPLVVQQLGIEKYSSVVWHQSIYLIASVVIQFGFNIYGVAEFHRLNGQMEKQKDLYWILFFSRVVIFTCTTVCTTILAYTLLDSGGFSLVCLGAIYNLGDVFFLRWYLQASGKLKLLALIVAAQKVIQFTLILMIIRKGATEELYIVALVGPYLILNLILFCYMARYIGFVVPLKLSKKIIATFYNAGLYFSSRIVSVLVDKAPIFILELSGINGAAGVYDLVMKIVGACQTPFNAVCQAYFSLSFTAKTNVALYRILGLCAFGFFIIYIFVTSNPGLLEWYFGDTYYSAIPVLNILLCSIGINIISHNIGNSGLIPAGLGNWFNISVFCSAAAYCVAILYVWFIGAVTILVIAKLNLFYLAVLMLFRVAIFMKSPHKVE
jgi:PST family polysaccharide transporter